MYPGQYNYRSLLRNELSQRVERNSSYSLRSFARDLGLAPSMLSLVLKGTRNLSARNADQVAQRMGFQGSEADAFVLLVQLETAKETEQRSRILSRLQALNVGVGIQDLTVDRFRMIRDWYHLPILEMSELEGPFTPAEIARRLGITANDAALALERLERLELLVRDSKNRLRKAHDNLLASSQLPDEGLRHYHRQMLAKAAESIDTQTPAQKLIGSYNVAFDPERLPEAQELLKDFFLKIGRLSTKGKRRRIYHLASVFFDLTPERKVP